MSKVFKLGITDKNNKKINEVDSISVVANKGIWKNISCFMVTRNASKFLYMYEFSKQYQPYLKSEFQVTLSLHSTAYSELGTA